jgi:hypothetical protein
MKLYSTREAADALGLTIGTVKHHVYKSGRLHPQLVANQWVFTEDDLRAFKAWQQERAAVAALSPEEKKARHRAQQAAHMRRRARASKS